MRYNPGAVVSFISPETMSLVEVHMWRRKAAEPDFDLLEWVNDNPVRVLFWDSKDPITYNAEMLGRPAMFHYSPASGGTPDMSMVVFAAREHCFRIAFYGHSYSTTSEAEAAIYMQMLESFVVDDLPIAKVSIPTGWEQGAGLVSNPLEPPPTDSSWDQVEIQGVVESVSHQGNRDTFTLTTTGGERYTVDIVGAPRRHFRGTAIDCKTVSQGFELARGELTQVVGYLLEGSRVLAEYIAVEQEGEWQPRFRKHFFDINHDGLDPMLLSHYEEGVGLWLRGSLDQVLHLAVNSFDAPAFAEYLEQDTLASGELRRAGDDFRVQVERLYIRDGPCTKISDYEDHCPFWKQLYPPVETTTSITGVVVKNIPEANIVVLQRPVKGFVTITLVEDGQLLTEDGQPAAWEDVVAGRQVKASGEAGAAGTLLAQQVYLTLLED
jgi:hypothetical protein